MPEAEEVVDNGQQLKQTDQQTEKPEETQGTAAPNPTEGPASTETQQGPTDSILNEEEGEAQGEKPQEGAPEAYEPFEVDGQQFTQEQLEGFANTARELGLSQESAQKLVSTMVPTARKYLMDDLVVKSKQWAEDTKTDSEIGGAHFEENLGVAKAAYNEYATPKLKEILTNSGLGNHPEVVRLFVRLGKEMQQDKGVTGGASAPAGRRRRYPNSNMVVDD